MQEGKREGEEKYYQLEIANENVVEKTAHKEVHAQITINDIRDISCIIQMCNNKKTITKPKQTTTKTRAQQVDDVDVDVNGSAVAFKLNKNKIYAFNCVYV